MSSERMRESSFVERGCGQVATAHHFRRVAGVLMGSLSSAATLPPHDPNQKYSPSAEAPFSLSSISRARGVDVALDERGSPGLRKSISPRAVVERLVGELLAQLDASPIPCPYFVVSSMPTCWLSRTSRSRPCARPRSARVLLLTFGSCVFGSWMNIGCVFAKSTPWGGRARRHVHERVLALIHSLRSSRLPSCHGVLGRTVSTRAPRLDLRLEVRVLVVDMDVEEEDDLPGSMSRKSWGARRASCTARRRKRELLGEGEL